MGVIMLNGKKYKKQPVPEVGKEYHIFNDGKISPSRHSVITIAEAVPFKDCTDEKLLDCWRGEVKNCYWLYATETDYLVRGTFEDGEDADCWFVRTTDGGWFSLDYTDWLTASRLDINGSLYQEMLRRFRD